VEAKRFYRSALLAHQDQVKEAGVACLKNAIALPAPIRNIILLIWSDEVPEALDAAVL
jgi:hypothetical protein